MPNSENIEIGNRIKQRRLSLGLTLGDVASRIGVAISTIQRYEAGTISKIKLPVIQAIAYVLSVNPAWLIGKSQEMEPIGAKAASSPITTIHPTLASKIARLDAADKEKVEAYTDGLLAQDKYNEKSASSAS